MVVGKKVVTKTYVLTQIEILAVREALDHYLHTHMKTHKISEVKSQIAQDMYSVVRPLYEQFKDDYRLMR